MRIQTGQLVSLGYGRYVRSDEVVAVEPIEEGRGPKRRCLVWVRGFPDPLVASRSQSAIVNDLMAPSEGGRATLLAGRGEAVTRPRGRAAAAAARARPARAKKPPARKSGRR